MINKLKQRLWFCDDKRFLIILLFTFVGVVTLAIVQDYIHSIRNGYSFYLFESLLFKTFWFYFPPILFFIKSEVEKRKIKSTFQMCLAVIASALLHLTLVPITIWCLSTIFREQSYGVIKTLTYTLSNDLLKLILIYTVFIGWLKYLEYKRSKEESEKLASSSQYLVINSGKNSTRVDLTDVLYIKSATPYVVIRLTDKEYLHSESLKSIAKKLDARYVRIHRSSIVNNDKVLSYKSRLNGDYDLMLQDGTEIRLSRNYVKGFKSCYDSTQSSA